MIRPCLAFAVLALSPLAAHGQANPAIAEIRKMDSAWTRSYAQNDTVLAGRIMADDFLMVSTNGRQKTKQMEMADVRATPGMTVDYFRSSEVDIRVHGSAAVVAGWLEWAVTQNGRSSPTRVRYTATWAKGGPMGWQIIGLHVARPPA